MKRFYSGIATVVLITVVSALVQIALHVTNADAQVVRYLRATGDRATGAFIFGPPGAGTTQPNFIATNPQSGFGGMCVNYSGGYEIQMYGNSQFRGIGFGSATLDRRCGGGTQQLQVEWNGLDPSFLSSSGAFRPGIYTTVGLPACNSTAPHPGSIVYDTTAGVLKYCNGTAWTTNL